jgi:hypothetical protein
MLHSTFWEGLMPPLTLALNCWVAPLPTATDDGVMVTLTGSVTVTSAVPDLVGFAVENALTVKTVAVSLAPTVSKPSALMLVPLAPPITFQLMVVSVVPVTVALNCWVPPFPTETVKGDTVPLIGSVTVTMASIVEPHAVALTVSEIKKNNSFTIFKPIAVYHLLSVDPFLEVLSIFWITFFKIIHKVCGEYKKSWGAEAPQTPHQQIKYFGGP